MADDPAEARALKLKLAEHYTMLAVIWGLWSGFGVLIGLFAALFFGGFGGLITVLPDSNTGEPAPWWLGLLFGGFGVGVGGLIAVFSLFGVVAAVCLGRGHRWAVVAVALLALLNFGNFPIGTVLAAITLWTISQEPGSSWGRRSGPS